MSDSEQLTIPEGKIRFYNHFTPALDAGRYEIAATQKIDLAESEEAKDPAFFATQIFHVDARRFTMGPGDVHAVFPPANQEGFYEQAMPHMVLRKRALPWERNIGGGATPRPWLALLLFHGAEAPAVSTLAFALVAKQIDNPDSGGVMHPDISVSSLDEPGGRALCIDIPKATFEAIAPTLEDLPFLAHVRQVNTGGKELLGLDVDGWFSVILCNRLPAPGLNTVHLVSLEGCVSYLRPTAASQPATPLASTVKAVRMVSLASWSFTVKRREPNQPEPRSFNDIAAALNVGPLRVSSRLAATQTDPTRTQMATLVNGALERGYVPLAYDMRNGEKSAAWYRGPLLPVRVEVKDKDPFPSAEAALIYDSRTGMFDASYAVAWQIGRLLALADAQFSSNLSLWRQRGQRVTDLMLERDKFLRRMGESALLEELNAITGETDVAEQRRLLLEFVGRLRDPKTFSKALGHFVAGSADASPLAQLKSVPDGKLRLAGGLRPLTAQEIAEIEKLPPGLERGRKIGQILQAT
jgi:hypothetical protein